jgi:hypothetical protein
MATGSMRNLAGCNRSAPELCFGTLSRHAPAGALRMRVVERLSWTDPLVLPQTRAPSTHALASATLSRCS